MDKRSFTISKYKDILLQLIMVLSPLIYIEMLEAVAHYYAITNIKKNENPYQLIGYQDITSNTNFSALGRWGLKYGINYCGMIDQNNFLRALGIKEYQNRALNNPLCKSQVKIHKSYINYGLLMAMGMKFKVLIQQKGINQNSLSGLKFANTSLIKTIE